MIVPPNPAQPISDDTGRMQQVFRTWTQLVSDLPILVGSGSPEGVVDAGQARLYMDTTGVAGAIVYIKRDVSIAGDSKQGWILI